MIEIKCTSNVQRNVLRNIIKDAQDILLDPNSNKHGKKYICVFSNDKSVVCEIEDCKKCVMENIKFTVEGEK